MKTKPDDPAYPFLKWSEPGYGDTITFYDPNGSKQFFPYERGLTKRELFAAVAMKAVLETHGEDLPKIIAFRALEYADALINELNK